MPASSPRFSRSEIAGTALALAAGSAYCAYSLLRHAHYLSKAFDMGIYDQVVFQWSRFELPANTIQGFPHELGDHFSPAFALLAPGYWIHTGPTSALVGQSLLIALSIIPVNRAATRRLGPGLGFVIAVSYALCWGVWAAVDFDFHETAFAAPLIAWAIDAADLRRWGTCVALLGGLLLVKEDMGLVLIAFGVWLATQRAWRPAITVAVIGLIGFVVVNGLVMPAINGGHPSATDQRLYGQLGHGTLSVAGHVVAHPVATFALLGQPLEKVRLLGLTFGAFLFASLLSPLTLIALPQLLERLVTNDPHYWVPQFHYALAIMPILAIAAADGLARLPARAVVTGLAASILLFSVGSAASGPPRMLLHASWYRKTPHDVALDSAVEHVPADVPATADDFVLPHLSARRHIYPLSHAGIRRSDWLVAPAQLRLRGWTTVYRRPGAVVMRRRD